MYTQENASNTPRKSADSVYFRTPAILHQNYIVVMALRQHIEWDPEEVAAGYDLSSIYEEVDDNFTAPVISSAVNTMDQAGSVVNITAGLNNFVWDVVEQVVVFTINNTTSTPSTLVPTTVTPSTVSTILKRVVEHLGKEPSIPVATVCIS